MRSPVWMIAYAAMLALLGAGYFALAYAGPRAALLFLVPALAAILVATYLSWRR
jgi:hypothetical protein